MTRSKTILAASFYLCVLLAASPAHAYPKTAPWHELDRYQETITRKEFDRLLTRFFNPSKAIYSYLDINDNRVIIYNDTGKTKADFTLRFAPNDAACKCSTFSFKTIADLNALKNPADKPLKGVKIALDPGHIGGKWADMEERQISWANYPVIREGDANLIVAKKVKPRLEALGATVMMTHDTSDPVTPTRPADYMAEAAAEGKGHRQAEMYFYRREEIYVRGQNLKTKFQPDFTISLHFNATELSGGGEITHDNRHAIFMEAAFGPDEVSREMWRYFLFAKLLERAIPMEGAMGDFLTEEILKVAPLRANAYAWTKYTCPINDNPYNNGRNLAMTREFPGPTVLCEFFYMNNPWTAARMTAGDYSGTKHIEGAGGNYRSIYEDYADAVVNAVRRLFTKWTVEGYSKPPPTVVTKSWGAKPAEAGSPATSKAAPAAAKKKPAASSTSTNAPAVKKN